MGYAEDVTEAELKKLETSIKDVYTSAYYQMQDKTDKYLERFKAKDTKLRAALANGTYPELTGASAGMTPQEHYTQWRLAQIGRSERMKRLASDLSYITLTANETAASLVNDLTPSIFSLNNNFMAYTIEKQVGEKVAFNIYSAQAVKSLVKGENHTEFKVLSVDPKRDYKWNYQKIQSALTSGILQGKSIPELTDAFLGVMENNRNAAIRNARTAVTSAQNAGVVEACKQAEAMGTEILMQWRSAQDGRVRDSHAHLDGVRIKVGKTFPNGCRYPADPQGRPEEVYNCRCTVLKILPKYNGKTIESKNTAEDYNRWLEEKQAAKSGKTAAKAETKVSALSSSTTKADEETTKTTTAETTAKKKTFSDYIKQAKEDAKERFFPNYKKVSNNYFTFSHYVNDDEVAVVTQNVKIIKKNYVLVVDNDKVVYLKDFNVEPVHNYDLGINGYAVKLKRQYFKTYTFKSNIGGFDFEEEDTFDSLVNLAKEQDKANMKVALGHMK